MKIRQCAIVIAMLGLATPVFAQSSVGGTAAGAADIGASGVNESAGPSSAGVKAQGSGSAELNANRPGSPDRATRQ